MMMSWVAVTYFVGESVMSMATGAGLPPEGVTETHGLICGFVHVPRSSVR